MLASHPTELTMKDIIAYLKPNNPFALWIVYALLGVFTFWFGLLLWNIGWNIYYRYKIKRCADVNGLLPSEDKTSEAGRPEVLTWREDDQRLFTKFREAKGLRANGPLTRHLHALFTAGWHESQLDVRGLIKNTTDELFRANSLHRALLSIFIIIGLLGTLFGLADTLASLEPVLRDSTQINNDNLRQGLQQLLTALKGAFAPSILGVFLTVLGVVLFAIYMRWGALPLAGLLERMTLTVWVPQLMPTSSQRLQQQTETHMRRSLAAAGEAEQRAQKAAEFIEGIESKTGAFSETIDHTTETLKQMSQLADRLGQLSEHFLAGLQPLKPFQEQLQALYQQMLNESRAFQQSVQSNITGAQEFQRHIQGQLDSQHQQLTQVLTALQSYETAYVANRGAIDQKLGEVLAQAQQAFQNLSQRNEEIGRALDEALGQPLRAELTQRLGALVTTLQEHLSKVQETLDARLNHLGGRLRELDKPLNDAAQKFENTFINFNEQTDDWRKNLQREFVQQNELSQQQLQRLEMLNQQLPALLQQLSASSSNFSESSSSFAAQGEQLRQEVTVLTQSIAALDRSVDALSQQVIAQPGGTDERIAEVLAQQTHVLQELTQQLERLATVRLAARPRAAVINDGDEQRTRPELRKGFEYTSTKPGWRDRVREWFSFRRRR